MRPTWTDYYLGLAKVVSLRSHDIHTKHGCVITDQYNRILGTGYNGFPSKLEHDQLPLTRPEKYNWMMHAERNALANCIIRPDNGIAYVTGQCCNDCIMALWQHGVRKVIMADDHGTHKWDEKTQEIFDHFIKLSGLHIEKVKPDLSWLRCI